MLTEKDLGLRPHQIDDHNDRYERQWIQIYKIYQDACDRAGLLDFAELLLRSYELWLKNPLILQRYQQRFQHILVDEFQDTNNIQYAWIRLLAGDHGKVMIVGDDDQSIYGWRGAKIENIQRFLDDYPKAEVIRLEQNYRSTENILNAANILIANNQDRMGKKLWTTAGKGEPIGIYSAFNEIDEARYVVSQIKDWRENGGDYSDCAILYRNNSQSRVLEEAMIQSGIPYHIYGGFRFFERMEIKDALSYLRLISNPNDDAAFERVVNKPVRGIGDRSLESLRQLTREREVTLWQAVNLATNENLLAGRTLASLLRFTQLIDTMRSETALMSLGEQTAYVVKHSGLYEMYQKEKGEKGEARLENLDELVTATITFTKPEDEGEEELTPLTAFLTHASLEAGDAQADAYEDSIEMMTLHSAKGLEFPRVFMVGVEEGIFPSSNSVAEPGRLEEERRLAYVGITRAQKQLTISHAELRRQYGREERHMKSRFIDELPEECIQPIRLRGNISYATSHRSSGQPLHSGEWKPGQKVSHAKFGVGTIINVEGSDKNTRVQVAFQSQGIKWLIAAFAKLDKL